MRKRCKEEERERETGRKRRKIGKRNEIGNCSCATQTDNLHIIDCSPVCLYFYVWVYCICVYCMCVYCMCVYCMCVCSYHCRLNGIYMHAFVLAACKMKIYAHLMVAFGPAPNAAPLPASPPRPHILLNALVKSETSGTAALSDKSRSTFLPLSLFTTPCLFLPHLQMNYILFYFNCQSRLFSTPLSLSLSVYISLVLRSLRCITGFFLWFVAF